ncbi:hypothetical protein CALCODRAFT_518949 [Calocera cornea HHB12733]|uniref:F-box domain-containing protein n=1 Tax=Calocera cornea HHB12733 TaxID=1353952 RepID=A0A165EKX4_9BASI|nr:hypothetical protein CALCODRAFT_518949 [Calocera cornea HHB12733]
MASHFQAERVHHFRDMRSGTVEGPFELAPWQTGYYLDERREFLAENGTIVLALHMSLVLGQAKKLAHGRVSFGFRMYRQDLQLTGCLEQRCNKRPMHMASSPTYWARLEKAANMTADLAQVRSQYDMLVHALRCRAFLLSAPTAPVLRLSEDVLALIFEEAAECLQGYTEPNRCSYGGREHGARGVRQPFQAVAAMVCRRWRTAALGTGTLWTRFEIDCRVPWETVDRWAGYSKKVPVEVQLLLHCKSKRAYAACLRTLNSVTDHLRSLTLTGDGSYLSYIAARWRRTAPLLEQLVVVTSTSDEDRAPKLRADFRRAPKPRVPRALPALRHLTLDTLYPGWFYAVLLWDGGTRNALRTLRLGRHTHADVFVTLALLRLFPNLETLQLSGMGFFWRQTSTELKLRETPRVPLRSLRQLELSPSRAVSASRQHAWHQSAAPYIEAMYAWLQLLDVPALEHVIIPDEEGRYWLRHAPALKSTAAETTA